VGWGEVPKCYGARLLSTETDKMAGKGRVLAISAIFLSLAALTASFQDGALLLSLL